MTSKYAPDLDGFGGEDYGPAHARRQADAMAAGEAMSWGSSALVLRIVCRDKARHPLGKVYRTPALVIRIDPFTKENEPELNRLRDQVPGISRTDEPFADILDAGDDRDLEARCRCGLQVLDRAEVLTAARGNAPVLRV